MEELPPHSRSIPCCISIGGVPAIGSVPYWEFGEVPHNHLVWSVNCGESNSRDREDLVDSRGLGDIIRFSLFRNNS